MQGLTEFLPISSSGHLIILHQIFNLNVDSLIFDVALHFGTLLALLIFFRQKLRTFFLAIIRLSKESQKQNLKLLIYIFIATIPAVIAGFFLENIIKLYFRNVFTVILALIIGGFFLIIIDKYSAKQKNINSLKLPDILLIGIAQTFALIPGVSRSAITIIAGLGAKLQRKAAAEFSFLLAIPVLSGAVLKKMFDLNFTILSSTDKWVFVLGILSSFVVGYLVIKYFMRFLEKHSFAWFGWYRVVLGVLILFLVYFL